MMYQHFNKWGFFLLLNLNILYIFATSVIRRTYWRKCFRIVLFRECGNSQMQRMMSEHSARL